MPDKTPRRNLDAKMFDEGGWIRLRDYCRINSLDYFVIYSHFTRCQPVPCEIVRVNHYLFARDKEGSNVRN